MVTWCCALWQGTSSTLFQFVNNSRPLSTTKTLHKHRPSAPNGMEKDLTLTNLLIISNQCYWLQMGYSDSQKLQNDHKHIKSRCIVMHLYLVLLRDFRSSKLQLIYLFKYMIHRCLYFVLTSCNLLSSVCNTSSVFWPRVSCYLPPMI